MLLSKCFSNVFSKQDLNRGLSAEYSVITVGWFAFYCEWKVRLFNFLKNIIYSYINNCLLM